MYAWKALLSDDGLVNSGLRRTGLSDGLTFLNTPCAVIGGLVYGFVVFMILPIYASLERLDVSLIEAGKDLYHGPVRTFFSVTLPATRAGLYGGVLLVFLPALGDFVSAQLLGGASTYMIGNLVQQQFVEGQNWPLGSALTVGMMAALTVLMVAYLRATTDPGAGALMARRKLERKPRVRRGGDRRSSSPGSTCRSWPSRSSASTTRSRSRRSPASACGGTTTSSTTTP